VFCLHCGKKQELVITDKPKYRKTFTYLGKRYEVSANNKEELYEKIGRKKAELKSGNIIINENTTLERWIDEWLEVYKRPSKSVSEIYYKGIETACRLHIVPKVGSKRLSDIKRIDLQKILNSHEGKSFSHLSHIRGYMYELFEQAVEDELIPKNPASNLKLPNYVTKESVVLNDEEYDIALEVTKTHRAGVWIMLMLTCGLRPQETVSLTWDNVDLENRMIKIETAVSFVSNQPKLKDTKTKAGNRIVGIGDELYSLLKSQKQSSKYIVHNENGEMITATKIKRLWNSFAREVDIALGAKLYRNKIEESKLQKNLTPYSCRHTCITRWVLSGLDVKTVQILAGHDRPETTLKYYTHQNKEDAAKRFLKFQNVETSG